MKGEGESYSIFIDKGLTLKHALTHNIKYMIILSYVEYILNNIFLGGKILSKIYTCFKASKY